MPNVDNYLLVAAIDFGTTFSGFAFSLRHQFVQNPLLISTKTFGSGSGRLLSEKTSTCVLFDTHKQFDSFGFTAEDKYERLVLKNAHHKWYLFRRFKMKLYNTKVLERVFLLYDVAGKSMPAMQVFSAALKAIKDELLQACKNSTLELNDDEIRWVLTVPAIWTDASKQFMREAAERVGIPKEQLLLALEPEAASLYCRYLPVEKRGGVRYESFQKGSKYMVIDAGGGTVDITVHEVENEDQVKEIYKANGGNWGGTAVDENFCDILSDIVGKECFELFKNNYEYLELIIDFEVKKRIFVEDDLVIKIPASLNDLCKLKNKGKSIKDLLHEQENKHKCSVVGDKLILSHDCALECFTGPIKRITTHVQRLFEDEENLRDVTTILLVGGFSDSGVLQSMIRGTFPLFKIVVPQEAGLAVLKGAVLFGHNPSAISSRICRFTYGVGASKTFIHGQHDEKKLFVSQLTGKELCNNIFDVYVTLGQSVKLGEPLKPMTYVPTAINQKTMDIEVYISDKETPTYVDDESCMKLGKISVDISGLPSKEQKVNVVMTFSKTEFEVKVTTTATGKTIKANFDFLQ